MTDTDRMKGARRLVASLGVGVVFATAPIILAGCASTGDGAVSAVRELHSMTPCGMMMEAMMGHGQGGHSSSETPTEKEPEMNPETISDSHGEVGYCSPASPGSEL